MIEATGDADADLILSLFDNAGCTVAEDDAIAGQHCVDENFGSDETLTVDELAPGTYYVVVQSFSFFGDGSTFDITLDVVPPFCTGDIGDTFTQTIDGVDVTGNETGLTALTLGESLTADIDTADLPLHLCEGDIDYWLVGHMGGALTATQTTDGAAASELREAIVDVDATIAENRLVYTEGDVVETLPIEAVELPAGFYLLRTQEESELVGSQRVRYDFTVTHLCVGDARDLPIPALDRAFELQQEPLRLPQAPEARTVCAGDVDYVLVDALFAGTLRVTFGGENGRDVQARIFALGAAGAETELPVVATDDPDGGTITFTADVDAGAHRIEIGGGDFILTRNYTWEVGLPGLDGAPANDTCETATALAPSTPAIGRTIGADNTHTGACNFEDEDFPANDVFFRFDIVTAIDTQLTLTRFENYGGTMAVYRLPDGACPADIDTLETVAISANTDACLDDGAVLRLPQLAPGSYLVSVDDGFSFFSPPEGLFTVRLDTFFEGFPPPAACIESNREAFTLPAVGASTTLTFAPADFSPGEFSYPGCSARGDELVYEFTPTVTTTVRFETNAVADTVLALLEGICSVDIDDQQCNDDTNGLNSLIEATIEGGVTSFVVVDFFAPGNSAGTLTVTTLE